MPGKLMLVALVLPFVFSGCSDRTDRAIRTGSCGSRPHDYLSLWVANAGGWGYPKSERPRLSNVEVWVDGARSETQVTIVAFDSKLGWSESASFSVPETAESVEVRAHAASGKSRYVVTQTWSKSPNLPFPERIRYLWTVDSESIQPVSE